MGWLRRADNADFSYMKRTILNIERVFVAPIFLFGLFYVNTLKDENIFKLIRKITSYFDFLFGALFKWLCLYSYEFELFFY